MKAIQYIPTFCEGFTPKTAHADTIEELLKVDWIKNDTKIKGFHRFSVHGNMLMVEYNEGYTWWHVASLVNKRRTKSGRYYPLNDDEKEELKKLPKWDKKSEKLDMCYWYFGSLALFQRGGEPWKKWNKEMKKAIIKNQINNGCAKGSWDPCSRWGEEGGRVYSTALLTMCLEVYYRYDRISY